MYIDPTTAAAKCLLQSGGHSVTAEFYARANATTKQVVPQTCVYPVACTDMWKDTGTGYAAMRLDAVLDSINIACGDQPMVPAAAGAFLLPAWTIGGCQSGGAVQIPAAAFFFSVSPSLVNFVGS